MLKIYALLPIAGLLIFPEKVNADSSTVDLKCSGVLSHSENIKDEVYHAKMQVTIIFMQNKTGHVTLRGRISSFETIYTISRAIHFTYQNNSNAFGIYNMNFTSIDKAGIDNVPDTIFNKQMSLFSFNKSKIVQINTLPNENLLISSAFSPLFICVPQ
ncbi:FidL-like protein [Escherichia coli]|uniref:FidL-like protein n=1 Tax=Escherichia coli TaxID=562 RepID=UPI003D35A23C